MPPLRPLHPLHPLRPLRPLRPLHLLRPGRPPPPSVTSAPPCPPYFLLTPTYTPFIGIVFVALMKNYILGDRLKPSMWLGVGIIGVAVAMVGSLHGRTCIP